MPNTAHSRFLRSLLGAVCAMRSTTLLAGAASVIVTPTIFAQTAEESSYIAVVKGNDIYVRCGGAPSYYAFAKLNDGDLIKVSGEKFDWAKVSMIGPAFQNAYGYIKFSKGDTTKVRLAADGTSAVALGRIEITAPNLESKGAPSESWKSVGRLEAEQSIRVIETITTDKDTVLKVALPESAQGWINTPYIQKASADQIKQWEESLHAATAVSKPAKAKNPPAGTEKPAAKSTDKTAKPTDETPVTDPPADQSSEATHSAEAESSTPKPDGATGVAASQPEKPKGPPTLEDLEQAYKKLQREPVDSAEVGPLRELYLQLADHSTDKPQLARRASGRAEQLLIWSDLQKRRAELGQVQSRLKLSAEETEAVRLALERSAEYTAVGRIAASTIYDGKSLPKLLRLQDAATGRTLAYLTPDEKYELVNLVDKVVGIVGDKTYDGSLRLNIIAPRRIDILNPQQKPQP